MRTVLYWIHENLFSSGRKRQIERGARNRTSRNQSWHVRCEKDSCLFPPSDQNIPCFAGPDCHVCSEGENGHAGSAATQNVRAGFSFCPSAFFRPEAGPSLRHADRLDSLYAVSFSDQLHNRYDLTSVTSLCTAPIYRQIHTQILTHPVHLQSS